MKVINVPTDRKITRKLRANFFEDVKGYCLLISDNETFTVRIDVDRLKTKVSGQARKVTGVCTDGELNQLRPSQYV
jgi:3,4-dihydroxy-2-butanone 4-phosphate synthase